MIKISAQKNFLSNFVVCKAEPINEACLIFFEVVARTKMNYIATKEFKP